MIKRVKQLLYSAVFKTKHIVYVSDCDIATCVS